MQSELVQSGFCKKRVYIPSGGFFFRGSQLGEQAFGVATSAWPQLNTMISMNTPAAAPAAAVIFWIPATITCGYRLASVGSLQNVKAFARSQSPYAKCQMSVSQGVLTENTGCISTVGCEIAAGSILHYHQHPDTSSQCSKSRGSTGAGSLLHPASASVIVHVSTIGPVPKREHLLHSKLTP